MNSKAVTIRDIASAAGVSVSTAFRALKDEELVKPATRAKVMAAKHVLENEKMQIYKKTSAEPLSFGIIMPVSTAQDIGRHPSMFVLVTSFLSELSKNNISNTMLVFDESSMRAEDLLARPMDGYMITGTSSEQERLLLPVLSHSKIPCVIVNRHAETPYISCVKIDDKAATADATRYLISLGHTRIAYLSGSKNYQHTMRRMDGYLQAMNEAHLPVLDKWVVNGDYSETSGYAMGKIIASSDVRPTAVLCASDTIAIGCLYAMEEKNISVPRECSIIGFGNIESSRLVTPKLTTITQPSVDMGSLTAKILMQMIQTPGIVSQQIILQTRLIIRESTAEVNEK